MKKLLTICLLLSILFTSNVYSQEKRDNRVLTFLEYIATNSSNTIIKYMELNECKFLGDYEKTDHHKVYRFEDRRYSDEISIEYLPSGKLLHISYDVTNLTIAIAKNDLHNYNFIAFNKSYCCSFFKRDDYPYQFATQEIDDDYGIIRLITKESELYIK